MGLTRPLESLEQANELCSLSAQVRSALSSTFVISRVILGTEVGVEVDQLFKQTFNTGGVTFLFAAIILINKC